MATKRKSAAATSAGSREELLEDLQRIMADAEDLIGATAKETGAAVEEVRTRIRENLRAARARLSDAEESARAGAHRAASATDEYVRENPWSALGIAAAVGVLVGVLLNRR